MSNSSMLRSIALACTAGTLVLSVNPASSQAAVTKVTDVLANPLRSTPIAISVPINPAVQDVLWFRVIGDGSFGIRKPEWQCEWAILLTLPETRFHQVSCEEPHGRPGMLDALGAVNGRCFRQKQRGGPLIFPLRGRTEYFCVAQWCCTTRAWVSPLSHS